MDPGECEDPWAYTSVGHPSMELLASSASSLMKILSFLPERVTYGVLYQVKNGTLHQAI